MGRVKFLSSVDIEGTCIEIPNIKITSGATSGAVLTSDASGLGAWCESVDISSNLQAGQLLCYDGSTITGTTSAGVEWSGNTTYGVATRLSDGSVCSNVDLLFCNNILEFSDGASKTIKIADNSTVAGSRNFYICSNCGTCGFGGAIYLYAGDGFRAGTAGLTNGGNVTICSGKGLNFVTGSIGYACGGNVNILASCSYSCYANYSRGGCVAICGGNGCGPTSTNCGGHIFICGGCGFGTTSYGGCVYINAGNGTTSDGTLYLGNLSCGNICIGSSITGDIYICGLGSSTVTTCLVISNGCVSYRLATSDCRVKCNLQEITGKTSMLSSICAYSAEYHGTNSALDGTCEYVLLAQDIENDLPLAVRNGVIFDGVDGEYKTIEYVQLIPVLWSIVKEQQSQINSLQEEINLLKG